MTRVWIVAAAAALCALLAAPGAFAKEGVRAHLASRLALDAPAGETIRVVWRLYTIEDGKRRPFGAGGLFVRLRSGSGATATRAAGRGSRGRFVARVVVPEGGIGGIRFGLEGIRIIGAREERADMYFPLDNDPFG